MAIYSGSPSTTDERSTGVDSSGRTGSHRLFANQIAFGKLSPSDRSDYYQLDLTGAGVYQVIVSNDSANNYAISNVWAVAGAGLDVSIVDAAGNVVYGVGLADTPANGDGSIAFVFDGSPTAGQLYLRVDNRGAEAADYVLTLRRQPLGGGTVTIDGTGGNDTLSGTSGADVLRGAAGFDVLVGYAGNDVLDGGSGFDIAWYGYSARGVQVNLLTRLAQIGSESDQLVSVEGAFGSDHADRLTGSSFGDVLVGLGGNDTIHGGEGDDLLEGGAGNDTIDGGPGSNTLYYENARAEVRLLFDRATGEVVISTRSEGVDRVRNVDRIEFADGAFDLPNLVDLTAPALVSFAPTSGAVNVAQNAEIVVTFSEPVVVGRGTVTVRTAAGEVHGVYTFGSPNLRAEGNRLIIDPAGNLRGATDYRVDFTQGAVVDLLGNPFIGHTAYGFRTEAARPEVAVASASARESDGMLRFTLTLSQPSTSTVSLAVATDGSSTARAGSDFTSMTGSVTFAPGQTRAEFAVPVLPDTTFEPSEAIYLLLGAPSGGALLGNGGAVGYIEDDDAPQPLPADELVGLEWHLYPGTGANVLAAWRSGYTGSGIRVGIFDQGIDALHPDLAPNLDTAAGRVAADPAARGGSPVLAGDNHGTAVAGVVAAARNGSGSVGVAYGATLVSFYSPLSGSMANEIVNAYTYARQVDVLNDSWGFAPQYYTTAPWAFLDNFRKPEFAAAGQALKALADTGRGGLGTVVVQSAGNSFRFGDDTNLHNFQNSRYIVTVAATDINGRVTQYSSPGASVLVSAPGGGGGDRYSDIWTTDRSGGAGYSGGSYTTITGTSFSAPLVAGVVALMLDANPALGWRDVQQILAWSAVRTDVAANTWRYNGAGNWNGGGAHYDAISHDHGFGLVDTRAAVRLAESWSGGATSANAREIFTSRATPEPIPDGTSQLVQTIAVAQDLDIERVEATIKITHGFVGDLRIKLTSPAGTESWLLDRAGQNALTAYGVAQADVDFTFSTVLAAGENTRGTWTLTVIDAAALDSGTLDSWELVFVGKAATDDDTYYYSDELSDAALAQPARLALRDTAGTDTLNAAMVSTASRIDLNPGATSTIDGAALRIAADSTIENAWGGEAGDTLFGNDIANWLHGMDGNDRFEGRGGNDAIDGGRGIDTAVQTGARGAYTLQRLGSASWRIVDQRGIEGDDRLDAVERVEFAGSRWALDTGADGHAGKTAQILRALFGPAAATNATFMGIGLSLFDGGMSYEQIVALAVASPNFAALAGSRSNRDFVQLVYRNVVGVAPGAADLAQFTALLDSGAVTQASLGVLACQAGPNIGSAELVGIANSGVEYVPFGG